MVRALAFMSVLVSATAAAEPVVGTTLQIGEALGAEADTRVGSNIWVLAPLGGGWLAGIEVDGSVEGFTSGYRCGTSGGDVVPAIAVTCMQPSLGAHALAGVQAQPSPGSELRLEAGVGATALWLLAGDESLGRDVRPSALVRGGYMLEVLDTPALGASWWLGVALEERAMGLDDTRLARSVGLLLEGRSR
jgi:hypothetical protein